MGPFDNLFDGYFEKLKPHLSEGVATADAYANRLFARLDDIVDAVQSDETMNVRRTYPFTLAAGANSEIVQVPTDQDWVLETVTIDTDAATSVRISTGVGAVTMWGNTLSAAGVVSAGGNGLIFSGGTNITVLNSAGNTKLYLQFRFERKRAKTKATRSGQIQRPVTGNDARTDDDNRHAGTSQWAGNNVSGERHISQPI